MSDNGSTPAMEEPTGCIVCGKETDGFTVCVDCGVAMFMDGADGSSIKGYLDYTKKVNPERYNQIIAYNSQNHLTP